MKVERSDVDCTMSMSYGNAYNRLVDHEKIGRIDSKSLVKMLEEVAKDKPLVLILADTMEGNQSRGDRPYRMHEAKHIIIYESKLYQEKEQERQLKEERDRKRRENQDRRLKRRALVLREAMKIKSERAAEEQGRMGQFKEDEETNLLREAENNLIDKGLLEPGKEKVRA